MKNKKDIQKNVSLSNSQDYLLEREGVVHLVTSAPPSSASGRSTPDPAASHGRARSHRSRDKPPVQFILGHSITICSDMLLVVV